MSTIPTIFIDITGVSWKMIDDSMVQGIKPDTYAISNIGKVRNMTTGTILEPSVDHSNDNLCVGLHCIDGSVKVVGVHRLVAMAFLPRPENCDMMYVRHKNFNKEDNKWTNLEWTTRTNSYRARVEAGENTYYGSNVYNSNFTDEQVLFIADRLIENKTYREICELIGMEPTAYNMQLISKIKTKFTYANVTKNYDFSNYTGDGRIFSEKEVHDICKVLQDLSHIPSTNNNKKKPIGAKEVMTALGKLDYFDSLDSVRRSAIIKAISGIKCKKTYKDITSQYDF